MRADTHVSFTVPAAEPVAKCTFSQANKFYDFINDCYFEEKNILESVKWEKYLLILYISDLGRIVCVIRFHGRWILISMDITSACFYAKSQHNELSSHRSWGNRKIFGVEISDLKKEERKRENQFSFSSSSSQASWVGGLMPLAGLGELMVTKIVNC